MNRNTNPINYKLGWVIAWINKPERLRHRSREKKVPSSIPRLDISVVVTSQC